MPRSRTIEKSILALAVFGGLCTVFTVRAVEPLGAGKDEKSAIQLVQAVPPSPSAVPPGVQPPPGFRPPPGVQPGPGTGSGGAASTILPGALPPGAEGLSPAAVKAQESPTPGGNIAQGGANAAYINANDLTQLLTRSDNVTGVETQRRSPVAFDPRIRGFHVGQIVTYGDGGFFFPARIDLDTALSKFDPSTVQDVVVIKGPYSARYGPGFSFLDITTVGADPSKDGGFEFHGRSSLGYQTNGRRWDGLQTVQFAGPDFGVRATYDIRVGQDYRAGNDLQIPSSFNSQNTTFAATYAFSPDSKLEFKGLRVYQHDVEFPGLYFDINRLDTEAYTLRYSWNEIENNARLRADLWYNYTSANGDTHRASKQGFVDSILSLSFSTPNQPPSTFQDFSNTNFNELVSGYRTFFELGKPDGARVALGTDLNVVRVRLAENIRLLPTSPLSSSIGGGDTFLTQNQQIPESRSVDPGLFLDTNVPIGDRLTLHAGARADFIYTSAGDRTVTGNTVITPGTQNQGPLGSGQSIGPGQVPPPFVPNQVTFDPLIYSVAPNDPNLQRHFNLWSTYINADYKVDEHLTALIGYGYAQRPPTLTELYAAGPFVAVLQQGLDRLIGDPHLAPETLHQFDVGANWRSDRVRASVNGFYAWIDNYITYDANKVGNNALAINQVVFTNTDMATLAGGEAYVEVDVLDWLTPFGSMSYVQGEDRTHIDNRRGAVPPVRPLALTSSRTTFDTEALPGIPPLELKGGIRIHQSGKQPRWSVEFLSRSVMGQNNVATSLLEQQTSGFTIFDLRGFWQVNKYLLVSGGVENIGDKFYREHLDPLSGNALGDPLFRPGTNFYMTAQLTY